MAGTTTYYGISYPTSTDYVKDGATAMQTIADGFDSAVAIPTYNNQTGTTYTFVLADAGKTVTSNNASAVTFTIPPQTSVAWANNTTLTVRNLGAGVVTIAGGAGVTVTNSSATLSQYSSARIIRTASNAWTIIPEGSNAVTLVKAQTIGTAVSSIVVTNAFSSNFDFYKIVIGGAPTSSATNALSLQLGSSVTGYYYAGYDSPYTGGAGSNVAGNNQANFVYAGWRNTTSASFNVDLINPFQAVWTKFESRYTTNSGSIYQQGIHQVATSYTDFTIIVNGGNMTGGVVLVYGFKNSQDYLCQKIKI